MKTATWAISFGVLIGLLAGGVVFLVSRAPRGEPIKLSPPPTSQPLLVYVSGAVNQPGVYALPTGSRVEDAIKAANGFSQDADQAALNLAAVLKDGDRVAVPVVNATSGAPEMAERSGSLAIQTLINLNAATQSDLESLPHIGPALAERIVAFRQANGPFKTIEAIQDVSGIGPAIFADIKDMITVGGAP